MLEEDLNRQTIFVELRLARSESTSEFHPRSSKIIFYLLRIDSFFFVLHLSPTKETKLALAAPKVHLVRSSSFRFTNL